jgi:hypothetical protein
VKNKVRDAEFYRFALYWHCLFSMKTTENGVWGRNKRVLVAFLIPGGTEGKEE